MLWRTSKILQVSNTPSTDSCGINGSPAGTLLLVFRVGAEGPSELSALAFDASPETLPYAADNRMKGTLLRVGAYACMSLIRTIRSTFTPAESRVCRSILLLRNDLSHCRWYEPQDQNATKPKPASLMHILLILQSRPLRCKNLQQSSSETISLLPLASEDEYERLYIRPSMFRHVPGLLSCCMLLDAAGSLRFLC